MITETTPLPGLLVLRPQVFRDPRGWFLESFNARGFKEATGLDTRFVQDNESLSSKGVLRGLHFQAPPFAQGKLVRVISGAVLDVCLDIRPESPTFGKHFALHLDGEAKVMLWIPAGFAHGFRTLEDGTVFSYKCTAYYEKNAERTILWNDPALGIDWGLEHPILSEKDRNGTPFADLARLVKAT